MAQYAMYAPPAVEREAMAACPSCGRQLRKEDIRPGGFQCPWCKEHLRGSLRGGRVGGAGILLLACLLCYVAGVRGENVFFYAIIVWLPLVVVCSSVTAIFWPKFEKDPGLRDDFLHIVPSPDGSKK